MKLTAVINKDGKSVTTVNPVPPFAERREEWEQAEKEAGKVYELSGLCGKNCSMGCDKDFICAKPGTTHLVEIINGKAKIL